MVDHVGGGSTSLLCDVPVSSVSRETHTTGKRITLELSCWGFNDVADLKEMIDQGRTILKMPVISGIVDLGTSWEAEAMGEGAFS